MKNSDTAGAYLIFRDDQSSIAVSTESERKIWRKWKPLYTTPLLNKDEYEDRMKPRSLEKRRGKKSLRTCGSSYRRLDV